MKRICGLLLSGICLLLGVLQARAQTNQVISSTTNYWVQNVSATITAYVQSGGSAISGTLPSKQLLTFLSSVTNLFNTVQTITNSTVTNSTVTVTDSPDLPPTNFPAEFDLTNYVLTEGSFPFYTTYTNGVNFTNDIVFTQTGTNPITYTFTNVVELTNGQAVYLFPNVPASSLTAVLSTNSNESNVVFDLTGVVTNTTHTPIYEVFPDFSKQRGAKLICVTPIQTETLLLTNGVTTNIVTAAPQKLYMVRYSIGKTVTNVDVSDCFGEVAQGAIVSTPASQFTKASYGLTRLVMDTTQGLFGAPRSQPGVVIDMTGFDFQLSGITFSKGKPILASVTKTRKLTGGGDGQVNGQIGTKTFNQATAVYNGSITFGVGHLESRL